MTPRERFLKLLREDVLQVDLADLDFGIYRILNHRRAQIDARRAAHDESAGERRRPRRGAGAAQDRRHHDGAGQDGATRAAYSWRLRRSLRRLK